MISFIIIGRNEGWKLRKCFYSIKELITFNSLQKTETIYVDSDSEDDSIEIAKENNVDYVIKISGNINSAVARNVGAEVAAGEVLFFIDGDIELIPFSLEVIQYGEHHLKFSYIVGFLDDVNYTNSWDYINQTPRSYKNEIKDQIVTIVGGGIFIIEKAIWKRFGGMDERLKRTQDRDFSLRMAKKGIFGIRKEEIFGLHHTIPYKNSKRMWKMLFDYTVCYNAVTIRRHFFNKHFWPKLLTEEFPLGILLLSIPLIILSPWYLVLYFICIVYKTRKHFKNPIHFISVLLNRLVQDIVLFISIFLFYPREPNFIMLQEDIL